MRREIAKHLLGRSCERMYSDHVFAFEKHTYSNRELSLRGFELCQHFVPIDDIHLRLAASNSPAGVKAREQTADHILLTFINITTIVVLLMKGTRFKKLRLAKGYSQSQVARESDVHVVTVSWWERGEIPIPRVAELALAALKPKGKQVQR
jgi:DNA-binding transcriptional regulator YiaG